MVGPGHCCTLSLTMHVLEVVENIKSVQGPQLHVLHTVMD